MSGMSIDIRVRGIRIDEAGQAGKGLLMAKRLNMIRLTLVIPMSLNEWLNVQAKLACKSKTRYIEELLKQAKQESDTKNLLDIE